MLGVVFVFSVNLIGLSIRSCDSKSSMPLCPAMKQRPPFKQLIQALMRICGSVFALGALLSIPGWVNPRGGVSTIMPHCKNWCKSHRNSWEDKCGWDSLACASCAECSRTERPSARVSPIKFQPLSVVALFENCGIESLQWQRVVLSANTFAGSGMKIRVVQITSPCNMDALDPSLKHEINRTMKEVWGRMDTEPELVVPSVRSSESQDAVRSVFKAVGASAEERKVPFPSPPRLTSEGCSPGSVSMASRRCLFVNGS